jgi:hypothetical protein
MKKLESFADRVVSTIEYPPEPAPATMLRETMENFRQNLVDQEELGKVEFESAAAETVSEILFDDIPLEVISNCILEAAMVEHRLDPYTFANQYKPE